MGGGRRRFLLFFTRLPSRSSRRSRSWRQEEEEIPRNFLAVSPIPGEFSGRSPPPEPRLVTGSSGCSFASVAIPAFSARGSRRSGEIPALPLPALPRPCNFAIGAREVLRKSIRGEFFLVGTSSGEILEYPGGVVWNPGSWSESD